MIDLDRIADVFARYDLARVTAYRNRLGNDNEIEVRKFGSATAILFPEVDYFNSVYGVGEEELSLVEEIIRFYSRKDRWFRLHLLPGVPREAAGSLLGSARFRPDEGVGWYHQELGGELPASLPEREGITCHLVDGENRERFVRTYLEGFDAAPERPDAAVQNMLQLFDIPDLYFLETLVDGRMGGVGMLYVLGDLALLAAGTTLPGYRQNGCHLASLVERRKMAQSLGCRHLVAMRTPGADVSGRNMEKLGLRCVWKDLPWRFGGKEPGR